MSERKRGNQKRFLKKHSIRITKKHLTSDAGLNFLHRFWQQLGGEDWINQQLGSLKADNSVYSLGRVITILLLAIIQGARHVSHILQIAHDNGLRRLWVTNLPLSPDQLKKFYNQHTTCENLIDVGKNQVGWCGMLTHRFWTNDLIFQLAMLAHNLKQLSEQPF
jgi:hypothetical protein